MKMTRRHNCICRTSCNCWNVHEFSRFFGDSLETMVHKDLGSVNVKWFKETDKKDTSKDTMLKRYDLQKVAGLENRTQFKNIDIFTTPKASAKRKKSKAFQDFLSCNSDSSEVDLKNCGSTSENSSTSVKMGTESSGNNIIIRPEVKANFESENFSCKKEKSFKQICHPALKFLRHSRRILKTDSMSRDYILKMLICILKTKQNSSDISCNSAMVAALLYNKNENSEWIGDLNSLLCISSMPRVFPRVTHSSRGCDNDYQNVSDIDFCSEHTPMKLLVHLCRKLKKRRAKHKHRFFGGKEKQMFSKEFVSSTITKQICADKLQKHVSPLLKHQLHEQASHKLFCEQNLTVECNKYQQDISHTQQIFFDSPKSLKTHRQTRLKDQISLKKKRGGCIHSSSRNKIIVNNIKLPKHDICTCDFRRNSQLQKHCEPCTYNDKAHFCYKTPLTCYFKNVLPDKMFESKDDDIEYLDSLGEKVENSWNQNNMMFNLCIEQTISLFQATRKGTYPEYCNESIGALNDIKCLINSTNSYPEANSHQAVSIYIDSDFHKFLLTTHSSNCPKKCSILLQCMKNCAKLHRRNSSSKKLFIWFFNDEEYLTSCNLLNHGLQSFFSDEELLFTLVKYLKSVENGTAEMSASNNVIQKFIKKTVDEAYTGNHHVCILRNNFCVENLRNYEVLCLQSHGNSVSCKLIENCCDYSQVSNIRKLFLLGAGAIQSSAGFIFWKGRIFLNKVLPQFFHVPNYLEILLPSNSLSINESHEYSETNVSALEQSVIGNETDEGRLFDQKSINNSWCQEMSHTPVLDSKKFEPVINYEECIKDNPLQIKCLYQDKIHTTANYCDYCLNIKNIEKGTWDSCNRCIKTSCRVDIHSQYSIDVNEERQFPSASQKVIEHLPGNEMGNIISDETESNPNKQQRHVNMFKNFESSELNRTKEAPKAAILDMENEQNSLLSACAFPCSFTYNNSNWYNETFYNSVFENKEMQNDKCRHIPTNRTEEFTLRHDLHFVNVSEMKQDNIDNLGSILNNETPILDHNFVKKELCVEEGHNQNNFTDFQSTFCNSLADWSLNTSVAQTDMLMKHNECFENRSIHQIETDKKNEKMNVQQISCSVENNSDHKATLTMNSVNPNYQNESSVLNVKFGGFKLASGQAVFVSDEAIKRANHILNDSLYEALEITDLKLSSTDEKYPSRKSTGNGCIKLSRKVDWVTKPLNSEKMSESERAFSNVLEESKSAFWDVSPDEISENRCMRKDEKLNTAIVQFTNPIQNISANIGDFKAACLEFKTASGNPIKTSETSYDIARTIFNEEYLGGRKSMRGKNFNSQDKATLLTNKQSENVWDEQFIKPLDKDECMVNEKTSLEFKTALGTEISVKNLAVKEAENKFQNEDFLKDYIPLLTDNQIPKLSFLCLKSVKTDNVNVDPYVTGSAISKGISCVLTKRNSTGESKNVKNISYPYNCKKPSDSEASLTEFESSVGNDNIVTLDEIQIISDYPIHSINDTQKSLSVADMTNFLIKDRNVSENPKLKLNACFNDTTEYQPNKCFVGFQTALGEKVAVSKEALNSAKIKLNKIGFDDQWVQNNSSLIQSRGVHANHLNDNINTELEILKSKNETVFQTTVLPEKYIQRDSIIDQNQVQSAIKVINSSKSFFCQEGKKNLSFSDHEKPGKSCLRRNFIPLRKNYKLPKESKLLPSESDSEPSLRTNEISHCDKIGLNNDRHVLKTENASRTELLSGQNERISEKANEIRKPGKIWLQRCSKSGLARISLRNVVGNVFPDASNFSMLLSCGVKESTLQITSSNAEDFIFPANEYFFQQRDKCQCRIVVGDHAILILSATYCAGKHEFYKAFLDSPGVNPKLVSECWFFNHFRWVVLKLASLEVSFPKMFGGSCFSPDQVMYQLKWRYDCEIDHSMRSALKKIYEKDDTPSKTIVLFISSIAENSQRASKDDSCDKHYVDLSLKVSDGWYEIAAQTDAAMCHLIKMKKLMVGQKIITSGAELVGINDPCDPLEAPENILLKINTNSTRRAQWDCRLGYFKRPQPFPVPLCSLLPDGGPVGCVKVVITRIYPMLFMEKYQDGKVTLRNERLEILAVERYEKLKQSHLEKLSIEVEKSLEERKHFFPKNVKSSLGSSPGEFSSNGICLDLERIKNFENNQEHMNIDQMERLSNVKTLMREQNFAFFKEKLEKAISDAQSEGKFPCERVVTPLIKVHLRGALKKDKNHNGAVLTIWRPSENVLELLKEGKALGIYFLSVNTIKRDKFPELQLNSMKSTKFEEITIEEATKGFLYCPRKVTPLCGVELCGSMVPPDIDVVGVIIHISPTRIHTSRFSQIMYITDAEFNFLTIKFPNGIEALGLQCLLHIGEIISIKNLLIDHTTYNSLPQATATMLSVFSTNPKDLHLQGTFHLLQSKLQNIKDFVGTAKESLQLKLKNYSELPKSDSGKYATLNCSHHAPFTDPQVKIKSSKNHLSTKNNYSVYSPILKHSRNNLQGRLGFEEKTSNRTKSGCEKDEQEGALKELECFSSLKTLALNSSPATKKAFKIPKMHNSTHDA